MLEIWQQFKQDYLIKYWNPVAAVIAAGLLSAYYFGVTGNIGLSQGNSLAGADTHCKRLASMFPSGAITKSLECKALFSLVLMA